jgi:hypothetical protein
MIPFISINSEKYEVAFSIFQMVIGQWEHFFFFFFMNYESSNSYIL